MPSFIIFPKLHYCTHSSFSTILIHKADHVVLFGGTPYNGGEALPERCTFFRPQVYKRVGISQAEVEVYTVILQSDLFHLKSWSEAWQLDFNANKCEIMRVTHNRDKSVPIYSLVPRGELLSSVSAVKDLGITISQDLSWT